MAVFIDSPNMLSSYIDSKMLCNEYKKLPFNQRIKKLYEEGDFIMSIRYYQYKINLYLLGNFYVEVFVAHKDSSIARITLLDADSARLSFYADQIKISEVFFHNP